eukprot:COSAG01_NODE_561_length_15460_cov_95.444307_14_plen_83_part_00
MHLFAYELQVPVVCVLVYNYYKDYKDYYIIIARYLFIIILYYYLHTNHIDYHAILNCIAANAQYSYHPHGCFRPDTRGVLSH